MPTSPTRDELAARYFEGLPYPPYPVQEEALLAWFTSAHGVLVCAPTGTGKTLIAEAALFEALHTGKMAYYTTPLIALTEQKFQEMQERARDWGFSENDVGLVTGNRRVNPEARVLVVVAEILVNRLLHREAFDFANVSAVVMDEFHNFADPERGIVWELALGMLPPHVRLLLLSATVGNAPQFVVWLEQAHGRKIELVQGTERRVPLSYHWVGDQLLNEQIELMADGDALRRRTPALVFCFNREECWNVAEQLKGKALLGDGQQARLVEEIRELDWSQGAGPKLKQVLLRGVGVHHAGVLPKYRRVVEDLFQKKLLSVCVCTETLAAGINLPARSVVIPMLLKGPPGDKKLVDPSSAHQMFGRAGRPQFDTEGYVFALAHEDDVKIARWREKFNAYPEDSKDPGVLKAKKDLKRKQPSRRSTEQYWSEQQFVNLCQAPPGKLFSKGPLPWRLLAYMLKISPELSLIRQLVGKRLMDSGRLAAAQRKLEQMLLTLHSAGYVKLEPEPPKTPDASTAAEPAPEKPSRIAEMLGIPELRVPEPPPYLPLRAHATPELDKLLALRGVNPLYGVFLVKHLGIASEEERIEALESLLEMPFSLGSTIRVPGHDELPPGPLAVTRIDPLLLQMGLATPEEILPPEETDEERELRRRMNEPRPRPLTLADKLNRLFAHEYPTVDEVRIQPVWAAGELLRYGGNFNNYVTARQLVKQEGIVFRHVLRFILLCGEFSEIAPPDYDASLWRAELKAIAERLAESCRKVDPSSTDKALEEAQAVDPLLAKA